LSGLNLAPDVQEKLQQLGNHGITQQTWSTYRTAERLLLKCCKERKITYQLPTTQQTILTFIHWLATVRKIKASTINTYLAGIRQLHISKGIPPPIIKSELVTLITRGMHNIDNRHTSTSKKKSRQPFTVEKMRILKHRLREWNNRILKERLTGFVDMSMGSLTTHCFRIGMASMLGQLGHDDGEIQAVGRWSSRAFEAYIKLPRTKRIAMAKRIARKV
jgi:hypothetical protein